MCCCCDGRIIIGNARLCWAGSLGGHSVNASYFPADCSPDWLLMTFWGHRHVKLLIYWQKKSFPVKMALSTPFFLQPPLVSSNLHICLCFCIGLLNCDDMLWSSAKFTTSEPGSCFAVKASVCVYVRVHFTHVTDMGQPWLLLRHTPTGRLFSKRIFSELQITITALVMWNHLAVGTSFSLPASPT